MSSSHNEEHKYVAVYGTLRDDIPSSGIYGYRDEWIKDCIACDGSVKNFKIYYSEHVPYPFGFLSNSDDDIVKVRLLTWPTDEMFAEKLKRADSIEGYHPGGTRNLYERTIVEATKMDDGKVVEAYVYHQLKISSKYKLIESGDFVQHISSENNKKDDSETKSSSEKSGENNIFPLLYTTIDNVKHWFDKSKNISPKLKRKRVFYFAYGSNMRESRLKQRVGTFYRRIPSVVSKHALTFDKKAYGTAGYANIVPHDNGIIMGILYELDESQLDTLDRYEGVNSNHYYHDKVKVLLPNRNIVSATTYIACDDARSDGLSPTEEYKSHLIAGEDILPKFYVDLLKKLPTSYTS